MRQQDQLLFHARVMLGKANIGLVPDSEGPMSCPGLDKFTVKVWSNVIQALRFEILFILPQLVPAEEALELL